MNVSDDPLPEFWMPAEHQAAVLKMWITGEPAKTFVLERLSERLPAGTSGLNAENITASTIGYMEELVTQCCKEAVEKIECGQLVQPTGWLMEICDLLNLARCWDGQKILQTPSKRKILQAQLAAIVARLKGGDVSVLDSTLRAVEEELRTMQNRE